jgi:hypothetical protein
MCCPVNVDHSPSWNDVGVAEAAAPPRSREEVRRVRHGLHPTRDRALDLSKDQLVGVGDCGQARQADVVERDRGDLLGDSGSDRCLPRGDLSGTGLRTCPITT